MPSRTPNEGILAILPLSDPGFLAHRRHPEWPAFGWSTPGERPILLVLHSIRTSGASVLCEFHVQSVQVACPGVASPLWSMEPHCFLLSAFTGECCSPPVLSNVTSVFVAAHSLLVEYGSSTGSWMLMFSSSIWGLPRVSNIVLLSHNFILVLSSVVIEFPGVFFRFHAQERVPVSATHRFVGVPKL